MTTRATALADRLRQGADALTELARTLDAAQWHTPIPGDGRTIGVVIHHVASAYPVEIELARSMATGHAIEGVTSAVIDGMNAEHTIAHAHAEPGETIEMLRHSYHHLGAIRNALTMAHAL